MDNIEIQGFIESVSYKPLLCRTNLPKFNSFRDGISESSFVFENIDRERMAISRWVSPKRTRSYPYSRIYDTFGAGSSIKKVTVIPIIKDEGKDGDRDFLQFDTISLMSLLNVYVILSHYVQADKSDRYYNKVTNQQMNLQAIENDLVELSEFHSSAVHWNHQYTAGYFDLAIEALESYRQLQNSLGVEMHSFEAGEKKIFDMFNNPDSFMVTSRILARAAQIREVATLQPKEVLVGKKAGLTIKNHLNGMYYFTADEFEIKDDTLSLVESKHSARGNLPGISDIKDGLFKMILFSNLARVSVAEQHYKPKGVLKLTSSRDVKLSDLSDREMHLCRQLEEEADVNGFELRLPASLS